MGGDAIVHAARRLGGRIVGLVWVDAFRSLGNEPASSPEEVEAFLAPFRRDFSVAVDRFVRNIAETADPAVVEALLRPSIAGRGARRTTSCSPAGRLPRTISAEGGGTRPAARSRGTACTSVAPGAPHGTSYTVQCTRAGSVAVPAALKVRTTRSEPLTLLTATENAVLSCGVQFATSTDAMNVIPGTSTV